MNLSQICHLALVLTLCTGEAGECAGSPSTADPAEVRDAAFAKATVALEAAAATLPCRRLEGRFAGGLPWRPFCGDVVASPRRDELAWPRVANAVAQVQSIADRFPGRGADVLLARLDLLLGRATEARARLSILKRRLGEAGDLSADESAAILGIATRPDSESEWPRAVQQTLGVPGPEACFNRALALTKLQIVSGARLALSNCGFAGDDPWRFEIENKIGQMESSALPRIDQSELRRRLRLADAEQLRALVAARPEQCRVALEEDLLPAWGLAPADERLARLSTALAQALYERNGDPLPVELVTALANADRIARRRIAHALVDYRSGLEHFEAFEIEPAQRLLRKARAAFESGGYPLRHWAEFYDLFCAYRGKRFARVLDDVPALRRKIAGRGYCALEGRLASLLGLTLLERGSSERALVSFREAAELSARSREQSNEGSASARVAAALNAQGRRAEAWSWQVRAARLLRAAGDFDQFSVLLGVTARELGAEDMPEVGELFIDEALAIDEPDAGPVALSEDYWWRADLRTAAGRSAEAREDVRKAREQCALIKSPTVRARKGHAIAATEAAAWVDSDARRAVGLFDETIASYDALGYRFERAELLVRRARAKRRLGDLAGAAGDFDRALKDFEEQRVLAADPAQRRAIFERALDAADGAIELAVQTGDTGRALAVANAVRARSLAVDTSFQSSLVSVPRVQVSSNTTQVFFYVLPEKVLVWISSGDKWELTTLSIGERALRSSLDALRGAATLGDRTQWREVAGDLFETLVAPWWRTIPPHTSKLVLFDDKELTEVPFAGLFDKKRGRFLIEDVALSRLPSLSLLDDRKSHTPLGAHRALLVAAPSVGSDEYGSLPELPGAVLEVEAVRNLLPGAEVLSGAQATPDGVLHTSPDADLIYIAAHVVPSREDDGRVVLPGPGDSSAALSGMQIARLDLRRAPVVVLSACSSAAGQTGALDGNRSIARAFLVAGARAVLSTLWPVDDAEAARVLPKVVERWRAMGDLARALQAVQVEAANETSPVSPTVWAGLIAMER